MKKYCWYHRKGELGVNTRLYVTEDSVSQIKRDMFGNNSVLEAICVINEDGVVSCQLYNPNRANNIQDYIANTEER